MALQPTAMSRLEEHALEQGVTLNGFREAVAVIRNQGVVDPDLELAQRVMSHIDRGHALDEAVRVATNEALEQCRRTT